jgi:hypothetical protein
MDALLDAVNASKCRAEIMDKPKVIATRDEFDLKVGKYFQEKMAEMRAERDGA